MADKVTILGINGHLGHQLARAFVARGWQVTGMGRTNKAPIDGVRFVAGDAGSVNDLARAIDGSQIAVNALNLPYHQWDKGRYEGQLARVIEAMGTGKKVLMFPGNVYNFSSGQTGLRPDTAQQPETPRGALRVRMEAQISDAVARGDIKAIVIRAGDFYGPDSGVDWYSSVILANAKKGKVAMPAALDTRHSWAYLPDLGEAFARIAEARKGFAPMEVFHFGGHFVSYDELLAAIREAAPVPLKLTGFPWTLFRVLGLGMPMLRELLKMRYLWETEHRLVDPRLDAILGEDFGTPFQEAVGATVAPFFAGVPKKMV